MTDDAMAKRSRFTVEGSASADLPIRLLNLFAQQDLAFDRVTIVRVVHRYVITIDHWGLSCGMGNIILEKMRAMVLVSHADREALGDAAGTRRDAAQCI